MHIILLSGGSGKRLWPLSNDVRSKQFLKLFRNEQGEYESMVQRVYRQIKSICADVHVTIATSSGQRSAIRNQLGESVNLCIEPARRDTFPAIALAAAHMHSVQKLPDDTVVIVCPIDPYVQTDYFRRLLDLEQAVQSHGAALMLMGVKPTYPSEKFGYLLPERDGDIQKVIRFQEKPDVQTAQALIRQGALWNCGVFAFRLGYMRKIIAQYMPFSDYKTLSERFVEFPKISFDYAVVEKETDIACIRYDGEWKDVGTWNTLAEEMAENTVGHVVLQPDCINVHAINELGIPMVVMGAQNMVVVAGPDGILVSDKEKSSMLKPVVDQLEQRVMFEEKSWGQLRILHEHEKSLTLLLCLTAGKSLGMHSHEDRCETWTVLSGKGISVVDGMTRNVGPGDVILLPKGVMHQLQAYADMEVVEVQINATQE